jgi:hypothetical protein
VNEGPPGERGRSVREALVGALAVTLAVGATTWLFPKKYVATAVGLEFLLATWVFVWRRDDDVVRRCGVSFSGLLLREPLDAARIAKDAGRALAWAFGLGAVFFVPYYFGWRAYWHPHNSFFVMVRPVETLNTVFGQLLLVALPEEAFYRGFLQTRLDDVWAPRLRVLGASVGPGLLVASLIFALGHFLTIPSPARLAVFFPSLVFGWLRTRTRGVGAGLAFHALCNIFSETLGKGFAVY